MTILATDSFFVLSGFLSVKCFIQKDSTICRYLRILFQRYMRLIPTAAFLIITLISVKNIHGLDGYLISQSGDCKHFWWTSMLLIQTYYNPNNTCIGPLWFTAVCWHIFIITPIILKLLKFSNRLVRMFLIVTILACTFIPGFRHSLGTRVVLERYTDTITRSYPYLFGVLYYHEFFKVKEVSKYLKIPLWIISIGILLSPAEIIFHPEKSVDNLTTTFNAIRIIWPLGICWLIHACHYGWGGIINKILSFKYFMPFSNICLGLYIMNDYVGHYIGAKVVDHTNGMKYPVDKIIIMFIVTYTIATVAAAVLYLCIEVPFFKIGQIVADSSCFTNGSYLKFFDKINYTKFSKKSENV
ncbi:O-acyltransferase like protein-like [Chironomus tepperi]|uniref:O-acyltransferase like protein-like n=1 Tax=Chironomus tepperi TaxID=113505 RepID=UPI00391F3A1F